MSKRKVILTEKQFRDFVKQTMNENVDEDWKSKLKNGAVAAAVAGSIYGASKIDDGSKDAENADTRTEYQIQKDADDAGLHTDAVDFNDVAKMTQKNGKDTVTIKESQLRDIIRESIKNRLSEEFDGAKTQYAAIDHVKELVNQAKEEGKDIRSQASFLFDKCRFGDRYKRVNWNKLLQLETPDDLVRLFEIFQ